MSPSRRELAATKDVPAYLRILDLPAELIGVICNLLVLTDLKHMRWSCKSLKAHSITSFGPRYLSHFIVFLHSISLGVLPGISLHPQLSRFVKRVTVSGEALERGNTGHLGELLYCLQVDLEKPGLDTLMRAEAFEGFQTLGQVSLDARGAMCGSLAVLWKFGCACWKGGVGRRALETEVGSRDGARA